jgi:hypothetical protein
VKRSMHLVSAVAACGVAATGMPAEAQTAAHLSRRDISPAEQARDTMGRFATCVVRARPNMVREAVAVRPGPDSNAALVGLVKTECLAEGELRMDPFIFRGALFRALYLREFGKNVPAPRFAPDGPEDRPELRSFGECVIRGAPEATRAYVIAEVASPEEKQALAELGPALNGCINPREQVRFTPAALETHLAEALYENTVAQARAGSPGAAE